MRSSTSTAVSSHTNWNELHQNAVDKLASPDFLVRLGAIHILENVAKHSPEHHWLIIELLTAVLRHRLNPPNNSTRPIQVGTEEQAIITAIGRRQLDHDLHGLSPDSAQAQDRVIHFSSIHFYGASFRNLNFERALFIQSVLESCDFDGCHLEGAIFQRATFRTSSLGSFFQNSLPAYCRDADFMAANFESGDLVRTDLRNAKLFGVKFGDFKSDHPNAPYELQLSEVNFEEANLTGARFLAGMELHKVNLSNAIMKNTWVQGVDLTRALNISLLQKKEAFSDKNTRWPESPESELK